MNKKKILRIILIAFAALLVVLQFVQPEKIDGPLDPKLDLSAEPGIPTAVAQALKKGCYDCHSNEPNYPWYTKIGAVNRYITGHIVHGNGELNFSEWGSYSAGDKEHLKEEICEEMEEGNMPLWNYKLLHRDVILTEQEIAQICAWANAK